MPTLIRMFAACLAILAGTTAAADLYVVVNAQNPVAAMSRKEVTDLFMGRSKAFPGGGYASAFDLPADNPHRTAFYKALTGMTPAQINSYWSRLLFSGQTTPPQPVTGESAMLERLRAQPNAIGYLPAEPDDKALRVVHVLKAESR